MNVNECGVIIGEEIFLSPNERIIPVIRGRPKGEAQRPLAPQTVVEERRRMTQGTIFVECEAS